SDVCSSDLGGYVTPYQLDLYRRRTQKAMPESELSSKYGLTPEDLHTRSDITRGDVIRNKDTQETVFQPNPSGQTISIGGVHMPFRDWYRLSKATAPEQSIIPSDTEKGVPSIGTAPPPAVQAPTGGGGNEVTRTTK